MKNTILLVIALAVLVLPAIASPEEEAKLYDALMAGGDESAKALEMIIQNADEVTAVSLFMASGVALKNEDFTNSAYLFYVAKFRAQFDKEVFPPVGTGGNSPMVAFGALSSQLGSVINPEIMRRPANFSASLKLAKEWAPVVPNNYNPGWEYSEKMSIDEATAKLSETKKEFDQGMGDYASLLSSSDYFEAFNIVQDYNMKFDDSRPSKDAYDDAVASMTEIEKSKGIRGMFYDPSKTK
jgi:hypothetical protein|tara:strand:- start:106 stop:825 length:720 start_codon:yes stop_codon:yes gene_type:complete